MGAHTPPRLNLNTMGFILTQKRLNLKIFQMGLVLVAVPLLFTAVFILILAWMLHHAEQRAQAAQRGRDVVSRLGNLSQIYINCGQMLVAYKFTHQPSLIGKYDRAVQELPQMYEKLRALTKDHAELSARVDTLETHGNQIIEICNKYGRPVDESGAMGAFIQGNEMRKQVESSFHPFMKEIELLTKDVKKLTPNDAEEAQSKTRITQFLILGIVVDVVLTVMLSRFFLREINNRLIVLQKNAMRMRARKGLLQPISGSDEIAMVDKAFHEMADALHRAEQAKQEFVSMISHDLRSPLTSLQTTLAMTAKGSYGKLSEKGQTRIESAERNVLRLINLINELLDIEKMEAGMLELKKAPCKLASVVDNAIDSVRPLAESNQIRLLTSSSDVTVDCDANRLTQVLVNLLSNAVKYSPPEGEVNVFIENSVDWIEVQVKDQGNGIPAEHLGQIFDRFQQVESDENFKKGGSGLGLAIAKAIIEAHDGQIGVDSRVGQGTRMWFRLPLRKGAQPVLCVSAAGAEGSQCSVAGTEAGAAKTEAVP